MIISALSRIPWQAVKLRQPPTGSCQAVRVSPFSKIYRLNNYFNLLIWGYKWCERRDSNSHAARHWNLNPARLPIPPLSHIICNLPLIFIKNSKIWGGRRGLNPRQPESQSGALPTELRPPSFFKGWKCSHSLAQNTMLTADISNLSIKLVI